MKVSLDELSVTPSSIYCRITSNSFNLFDNAPLARSLYNYLSYSASFYLIEIYEMGIRPNESPYNFDFLMVEEFICNS